MQRAFFILALIALVMSAAPARAAMDVQEVTSPGGIKAWLVEDRSMPLIAVGVGFHGGSTLDPPGKDGLAMFVSGLLDEGAGDLDSRAFQQRLNDLAIDFRFDARIEDFTGSMRTLTAHRDEAFELLRLALTAPRFDAEPVERIRGQLQAVLADESSDPGSIADRVWWHAAFAAHPYGRQTSGTAAGLAAVTPEDLRGFVAGRFARDNLIVGVVGDIGAAELRPLLDRTFGALPATGKPVEVADSAPAAPGAVIVVDRALPQSVVLFGAAGIKRHDPDFYAAFVMNHILGGGGFASRLMQEVREKRGLAYSIGTSLVTLDHAGVVQGTVGTKNASVAETVALVKQEWRRMRDEGPTEQELADAKLYLTGSYALRFGSTSAIAAGLVGVQLEGFPADYFARRNDYIDAVTLADAKRVARTLLDPDSLTFVIVGEPDGVTATMPAPEGLF
ncbi:MAG: M16 family metallopeptidase [Dongiaceae bacterium]